MKLLQQLESCACGYDRTVMPSITNRQEQYSEKKTLQLINRLTDSSCPASLRSFYKSMLYCAIRCFSTPCTIQSGSVTLGVYNPSFTFGDLINYMHSEELDTSEQHGQSIALGTLKRPIDGFLSTNMTALYVFLSGGKKPEPDLLDGEFIPLHTSEAEDDLFCLDEEEMADAYYEEYFEEAPCQLEQPFPSPEEYCQHYENILRLFPEQYSKVKKAGHRRIPRGDKTLSLLDAYCKSNKLSLFHSGPSACAYGILRFTKDSPSGDFVLGYTLSDWFDEYASLEEAIAEYESECSNILVEISENYNQTLPSGSPEVFQAYSRPAVPEITPTELAAREEEQAEYMTYIKELETKPARFD